MFFPDVRASHDRCMRTDAFLRHFRLLLMAADPRIPEVFGDSEPTHQEHILNESVLAALDFAERRSDGRAPVHTMAMVHGAHGRVPVAPALNDCWVEALIEAARDTDPEWQDELASRWRAATAPTVDLFAQLHWVDATAAREA
ncbi:MULTISPECIES: hypothetical protein [unclassified Thioalkalivibrio]|uniref:hypothetical protein n=1 Tax=unclassified Thioalkalivibrio TaxID=2621013 RepID=UPI00035EEDD6|nr:MULTISPECIES: hypothetical protein [unclassified Thioalkalivibrio]